MKNENAASNGEKDNNVIKAAHASLYSCVVSVALLLLTLCYSAYAWFGLISVAEARGIELAASSSGAMMISIDGVEWNTDVNIDLSTLEGYGKLFPASSFGGYDGTLWQTAEGGYGTDENTAFYAATHIQYSAEKNCNVGYFLDIPLYFRTSELSPDGDGYINLYLLKSAFGKTTEVKKVSGSNDLYKSVRAAFLYSPESESDPLEYNAMSVPGTLKTTPLVFAADGYSVTDGVISDSGNTPVPPSDIAPAFTEPVYIAFEDGRSTVPVIRVRDNDAVTKIFVRIWIEGQDVNCVKGTGEQTFSVRFTFSA